MGTRSRRTLVNNVAAAFGSTVPRSPPFTSPLCRWAGMLPCSGGTLYYVFAPPLPCRLRLRFQQHWLRIAVFGHAEDQVGAVLEAFVEGLQIELLHRGRDGIGDGLA